MPPPTPPADPTPEAVAHDEQIFALHGHFTGAKNQPAPVKVAPKAVKRKVKKGGGC